MTGSAVCSARQTAQCATSAAAVTTLCAWSTVSVSDAGATSRCWCPAASVATISSAESRRAARVRARDIVGETSSQSATRSVAKGEQCGSIFLGVPAGVPRSSSECVGVPRCLGASVPRCLGGCLAAVARLRPIRRLREFTRRGSLHSEEPEELRGTPRNRGTEEPRHRGTEAPRNNTALPARRQGRVVAEESAVPPCAAARTLGRCGEPVLPEHDAHRLWWRGGEWISGEEPEHGGIVRK